MRQEGDGVPLGVKPQRADRRFWFPPGPSPPVGGNLSSYPRPGHRTRTLDLSRRTPGRTHHLNLQKILPASTDRARISGIDMPEISGTHISLFAICFAATSQLALLSDY